ncbi:MAG: ATP-binding cassette domain-containing protein, partial [Solirubrobacterales bacterium]
MSEPIIQIGDLKKSFGELDVLTGIDLEIEKGEVVCVIGPSGSGKSTLLRCINLLEEPSGGTIRVAGAQVFGDGKPQNLDQLRREVGMVFQQFNLFPHLGERDVLGGAQVGKEVELLEDHPDLAPQLIQVLGLAVTEDLGSGHP